MSQGSILYVCEILKFIEQKEKTVENLQLGSLASGLRQAAVTESVQNSTQVERMLLEEKIDYNVLREKLPTVFDQYRFVVNKLGYYLPTWKTKTKRPKWATEKYLVGIMEGRIFGIKKNSIKKPGEFQNRYTKGEMLQVLEDLAGKELGFETGNEPPVNWLKKVIYSLNPNHKMFQTMEDSIKRTIPEE